MLKYRGMILAVVVFLFCTRTDARVHESVELRVFNDALTMPKAQMLQLLERANLEAHGFIKEVVTEVKNTLSGYETCEKMHRYLKPVPCYEAAETEKQVDALLGGILGPEVDETFEKDEKKTALKPNMECKVGLEIHFRNGCLSQKSRSRRDKDGDIIIHCNVCSVIKKCSKEN